MKTITFTVRHGDTLKTITGTGATVADALRDLHRDPLGSYAVDPESRYWHEVCRQLEMTGEAQLGWGDYKLAAPEAPARHTPEPWQLCSYGVGHEKSHLMPIYSEAFDTMPAPLTERGFVADILSTADAARIVACVNACAGMTDPAQGIAALRAALAHALAFMEHAYTFDEPIETVDIFTHSVDDGPAMDCNLKLMRDALKGGAQ
jgi:hypothetical protein